MAFNRRNTSVLLLFGTMAVAEAASKIGTSTRMTTASVASRSILTTLELYRHAFSSLFSPQFNLYLFQHYHYIVAIAVLAMLPLCFPRFMVSEPK